MGRSPGSIGGSNIGSARNENSFAGNQASAQQPVRDFRMNQATHERLNRQFDELARRDDGRDDSRFRRDRLFRTRDFLIGCLDIGWPVDLIDTWCDAITEDEILVGMPSGLVLDYWGKPALRRCRGTGRRAGANLDLLLAPNRHLKGHHRGQPSCRGSPCLKPSSRFAANPFQPGSSGRL